MKYDNGKMMTMMVLIMVLVMVIWVLIQRWLY